MKILFPSEPFNHKEVDSAFIPEYEAAKLVGFDVFLFDHDEFVKNDTLITNLPINEKEGEETLVIRGWMFKEEQYASIFGKMYGRGYTLINTPAEYLRCHYFPEAFKVIGNNTSKCWWTDEWSKLVDTDKISWSSIRDYLGGDVLIKDYVKSEKGNPDLFILKQELSSSEFYENILKFIDARGKLFNKGIVLKQVEKLKLYDGQTNEWRIFFLNNKPINFGFNSEKLFHTSQPPLSRLNEFWNLGKTIESNFFTMDIAEKEDGTWMILELGDGQVSGLAAQEEPIKFYNNMYNVLHGIEA